MNTEIPNPNLSDAPDAAPPVENAAAAGQLADLISERDQLAREKAELQDRVLRLQAEFDNFRKRTEKDRAEFAQYAGMEAIREILPVLDNFELALKSDPASKEYSKGIEMIHDRLAATLKKMGLEPIDTTGAKFDPHIHQAVEKVQTEDAEDHTVISDFQRGYKFKGKLLRPSMVKVAVRP